MSKNNTCDLIRDLLPLYVDEVCSPTTKRYVEEHLAECEICRKELMSLKEGFYPILTEHEKEVLKEKELDFFRKLERRMRIQKNAILGICISSIVIAVAIFVLVIVNSMKQKVVLNEDYQGPVIPLSITSETEGITIKRMIECDYSKYEYSEKVGRNAKRMVEIQDGYTLKNTTDEDIELELVYGYVADYGRRATTMPSLTMNDEYIDTNTIVGRSTAPYGYVLDNMEGFTQLLNYSNYQEKSLEATESTSSLSQTVKVYTLEDLGYNGADKEAVPGGEVFFTYNPESTRIYTCGMHTYTEKKGVSSLKFMVPVAGTLDYHKNVYIVVEGEDIKIQGIKKYRHQMSNEETDIFEVNCVETNTTLNEILKQIVKEYKNFYSPTINNRTVYDNISEEQMANAGALYLTDALKGGVEKESILQLENYLFTNGGEYRVFYETTTVTIPANESVELVYSYNKYTGIKEIEKEHFDGLEILTTAGSELDFQSQHLRVKGLEELNVSGHTTGDELEYGDYEVELDGDSYEIYLEVPEKDPTRGGWIKGGWLIDASEQ